MSGYAKRIEIVPLPNQSRAVQTCSSCLCKSSCILSHLEPQDIKIWETLQTRKTYTRNETIFREGDQATGIYLVCKGMVKLSKAHSDGHQFIVRIVTPGHFFGLPPLICNRNHFTTSQAVDSVMLEYVPREKFMEFLKDHSQFTIQLIDKVANELCLARTRLRDFGCKNGRQRLADLLLWLGEEFGHPSSQGVELNIVLSRADIAGMAGLTTETTIRLLSSFRTEEMIEIGSHKKIYLTDTGKLRNEVGDDLLIDHDNIFTMA